MGRRSIHTPEELRELIIDATTAIVEQQGLEGLSAREIAKRIGYSPEHSIMFSRISTTCCS